MQFLALPFQCLLKHPGMPSSRQKRCNVQDALHPVNAAVKDAAEQLDDFSRRSSDLKFPIRGQQAQSWLLNTYLDSVSPMTASEKKMAVRRNFALRSLPWRKLHSRSLFISHFRLLSAYRKWCSSLLLCQATHGHASKALICCRICESVGGMEAAYLSL